MKPAPPVAPETWLYRHDDILTPRPYGVDVDADGWLWEGCGWGRIVGHHLDTAQVRVMRLPAIGRKTVYQVFFFKGSLVLTLGAAPFYAVVDLLTGACVTHPIPAANPIVWYGVKTGAKLILFERSESKAIIIDDPAAPGRGIPCPYEGQLASGDVLSDGLVYSVIPDPCRIVRFDPEHAAFVDSTPCPFPEAGLSGKFEHEGMLYCADSAAGRLLCFNLRTRRWLDPIPAPDYRSIYGYIGGGFGFEGKGYFCLSTYAHRSRLDPKTGRIILPEGPLTVDGRARPRFLDRLLIFDPAAGTFGYLQVPPQPDGVPLLCYNWCDGSRFAVTGIVIPFVAPGEPGDEFGSWLVLQNKPAEAEPALGPYDFRWDRAAHVRNCRRSYARGRSLYLASEPWTPPTVNMEGSAFYYPPGRQAELQRRAEKTDATAYWSAITDIILEGKATDADKVRAIVEFARNHTYYNPVQEVILDHPVALLEGHDIRCGSMVQILRALFTAAGIESRKTDMAHHVVAEAFYDSGWHIADALFFGRDQPNRNGRVLSVEELRADPYFADGFAQTGFLYDPEEMLSEDGYQVLGYVFGPWGSYAYYSWYLGAPEEHPPTVPLLLPVERIRDRSVRIRWASSLRSGGGPIEYGLRVSADQAASTVLMQTMTRDTAVTFEVPEMNRMYFIEVRAMDDHRLKNPATWYPPARSNFVLVPPNQYGWYGVM